MENGRSGVNAVLLQKIEELRTEGALTEGDERIAGHLLANPEDFAYLPLTRLKEKYGISTAAITRFSRKLAYGRLSDMRMDILRFKEVRPFLYADISKTGSTTARIEGLVASTIHGLESLKGSLDVKQVKEAARLLETAGRVVVTGFGGSASVAYDAYHKFLRAGKHVEIITDAHRLMIAATVAGPGEVFLAISESGNTPGQTAAVRTAKERGAAVIAVTQFSRNALSRLADVCLHSMRSEQEINKALISRAVSYAVVDILFIEYYVRDSERIERLQKEISENTKLL
ncbi:MAG: MurR/RpiR family transcriptional regulator [Lachnospiraceae bacterium]|nr:MurR/RpiR family transcriptional regulator [Lachnospiraceae bacterium]